MNHVLKEAPKNQEENIAIYFNPELPPADGVMAGMMIFLKGNKLIE